MPGPNPFSNYTPTGPAPGGPPVAPTPLSVNPNTLGASYAPNPYTTMMATDTAAVNSATTSANSLYNSAGGQMSAQGQAPYPSYPNSYGLGSQTPLQASSAITSTPQAQPAAPAAPDASSRGFNPWSLQGESNARQ